MYANVRMAIGSIARPSSLLITVLLLCWSVVGHIELALAQADTTIEEIIVTSRKLGAENVQDIPGAITAFGSETLRDMQVVDFEDFARQVPGLTFLDQSPGQRRYVIRGVQSAGQQQVAVYYDEVPLPGVQSASSNSGSQTTDLKLYDMERVEVLRGPQGTVFGANSQAGTVRMITKQPILGEFEAYTNAELSQTDPSDDTNWNVQAVANVPLLENLAIRVLAYEGEDAGYINNTRCRPTDPADFGVANAPQSCLNLKDYNSVETTGIRTNLLWEPSETVTLKGQFWWQDRDLEGDVRYHPYDTFGVRPGTDNGDTDSVAPGAFFETGKFKSGDYAQTAQPDEQLIAALTGEFELPFANVVAAVSRYERDFEFKFDSTWIITFLFNNAGTDGMGRTFFQNRPDLVFALTDQRQSLDQNAFEIRFSSKDEDSPLQWVVGAFYRDRETEFQSFVPVVNAQGLTYDPGTPFTVPPTSNPGAGVPGCHPCVFARVDDKDIEEIAVFGEINYTFADVFDINVGARWFEVDQTELGSTVFQFAAFAPNPPSSATPTGASPPSKNTLGDSEIPWKVSLGWRATEDFTVYGVRSNGFRLGGTNNRGIGAIHIPEEFGADELINYEVGIKTQWMENRVTWNTSLFFMEWDNLQVAGQDPTGAFGFIGNAGAAKLQGIESELFAWLGDSLYISGQFNYLWKKELTEDQVTDEVIAPGLAGDQIPRIPEFTASFTAQYNFLLPLADWNGFARVEGSYTDASHTELRPGSRNDRYQGSYEIFNARFGVRNDDMDLGMTLFVENIGDTAGDVYITAANGQPTSKVTHRPRTVGLQVTKGWR